MQTCDFCGRSMSGDTDALTWSVSVENGRTKHFCTECTRTNLRSAEAKLGSEWW